jgi:Tol biopolymer transport system component
MVGRKLSHYRIIEKIGSGGMGDVYVAEDTKLGRKVALKILAPEMASPERRKRFEREAKAVAALNHPNIVTIYSAEEADGIYFITMELVMGKTLTEVLPKKGLPLNQLFGIAIPLADALTAAHQEGITHRDLKPDNTMVSTDGQPKILDFGLAKMKQELEGSGGKRTATTSTQEGRIVGTVTYMSPEQAEGKPVDHRTDIFSLGIMLYEMTTGRRPFAGNNSAAILASIIKDTPRSVTDVNPNAPRDLAKLIKRCLAKDPIRRYQSTIEVRNELEELKQEAASDEAAAAVASSDRQPSATEVPGSSTRPWRAAGVATVLVLLAGILGYFMFPEKSPVPRLTNPVQVTSAVGQEDYPTWSPEGGRLAYQSNQSGNWDIWVIQVGLGPPINLTEDHPGIDNAPSWSPDGHQIAFWSDRDGGGYFVMSALGGTPRRVAATGSVYVAPAFVGTPVWSPDGAELGYVANEITGAHIDLVTLSTRESRRLSLSSRESGFDLSWSPDGRLFAYVGADSRGAQVSQLRVLRVADGASFEITDGRTLVWSPSWSTDGQMLYYVSNQGGSMDLWRQPIGSDGVPEGLAIPATTGVGMRNASFSPDGTKLAYSKGRTVANLWRVPILVDRRATWEVAQQLTFDEAYIEFVDVSPDGKRLLVSSDRAGNPDLWMLPANGGEMDQLTTAPTPDWAPQWSPDGEEIAFYAYQSGNRQIWVMPADGGGARQLTRNGGNAYPTWSPDGREVAFRSDRTGNDDIWVIPSEGGEARQVTNVPSTDSRPAWSPDGKWLVFRTGRDPEPLTEGTAVGLATYNPVWSRGGKQIYFLGATNLWVVSAEGGAEHPMTDLAGRPGRLGFNALATDGHFLYFAWREDVGAGDIWVMEAVYDSGE